MSDELPRRIWAKTEILAGQNESGNIDLGPYRLGGLAIPSDWTAADITFDVGNSAVTMGPLKDQNKVEVKLQVDAGGRVGITADVAVALLPWPFVALHSGTHATAVPQTVKQTIDVALVL